MASTEPNLVSASVSPLRAPAAAGAARGLLLLFLATLLIPVSLDLGSLRLTPYRILLLVVIVPFALQVLGGRAGRVTMTDVLMVLYALWIFLSLIVVHGAERIAYAGISSVELVGGYFAGRMLVRGPEDYRKVFRTLLLFLLLLLPFSLIEAVTGKLVIPDLLRALGDTPTRVGSASGRMGLERVYSVFNHPILYGLFCTMTLANFALIARSLAASIAGIGLALFMAGMSLSAGPLLAAALQLVLLAWYWIMKGRWKLFLVLAGLLYLLFVIAAERSLASFVIDRLTFSSNTGWIRLAIFDYGWESVMANPIFGIGLNDWVRPGWLTGSVDNFWLLNAMRYGLPGVAIVISVFLSHILYTIRVPLAGAETEKLRTGHLIVLIGTAFTLVTVHIWGSLSVFVMFYIGAGAWIYTARFEESADSPNIDSQPASKGLRYTRFPSTPQTTGLARRSVRS